MTKSPNTRQKAKCLVNLSQLPVSDPGFPVGGVDLVVGGVDSQGGYVLKILYVKTKESGSLGGACAGHAP